MLTIKYMYCFYSILLSMSYQLSYVTVLLSFHHIINVLSNKLFNVGCIFYQPPWILQNLYTNIPMIKLLHVHVIHDTAKSLVPEPT